MRPSTPPAQPVWSGATNGVRYTTAYDREIQDLFTAIRHCVKLDNAGRLLAVNNQRYLRTAHEMATLFRDVPGAVENSRRHHHT